MIGLRTLVLASDYQPISIFPLYTIPAEDAIVRVLEGSARMELEYPRRVLTPSRSDLNWASVIVNVRSNFKYRNEIRLKKETLYYRDHGICMYCENPLEHYREVTYDHLVPESKGGRTTWENIVCACSRCNTLKADSLPKGKWVPKKAPRKPSFFELLEIRRKFPIVVDDPRWINYLGDWKAAVILREDVKELFNEEDFSNG